MQERNKIEADRADVRDVREPDDGRNENDTGALLEQGVPQPQSPQIKITTSDVVMEATPLGLGRTGRPIGFSKCKRPALIVCGQIAAQGGHVLFKQVAAQARAVRMPEMAPVRIQRR